jgi:hypothetical protein
MKSLRFTRIFSAACILAFASVLFLFGAVIPATAAQEDFILVISTDPSGSGQITSGRPGDTFYLTGTVRTPPPASFPITIQSYPPGISANGFVTPSSSLSASERQLIPISITVPVGTPRASYIITVSNAAYGGYYSSTINFDITPRLTVTPASGTVGSTATVTGDGFQASSNISLYWDANSVPFNTGVIAANAKGVLPAASVAIPAGYRGQHYITAKDAVGPTDPAAFTIASKLIIAPTSGSPGDTVTLSGTGFLPDASVSIRFDAQALTTVSTDGNGSFVHASITIPVTTRGQHSITAEDTQSVSATFSISEKLSVTPTSGFVGDTTITINGSIYDANQAVLVYWDVTPLAITPAPITTSSGSFMVAFPIPTTTRGAHTVRVQVGTILSTATVTVNSRITDVNPTSGQVGGAIRVSGTGFMPGSPVPINFDGFSAGTLSIGDNGSFTGVPFTIPASSYGPHTLSIQGITYTVATTSRITLSPASGDLGDSVTITGNGFSSGKVITFKLDGNSLNTIPLTVTSDPSGSFGNVIFTIPAITASAHTVTATDQNGNSATATLTIGGQITITPSSGIAGVLCTTSGNGFAPNTPISIYWDTGATPVAISTTSATGAFSGVTFNAPAGVKGPHIIKAQDSSGNQASATFTTLPKIIISPSSGAYSDTVAISGTGFSANSNISMAFVSGSSSGLATTSPAIITTDNAGSYSAKFTVPSLFKGNWTVQIRDTAGNLAEAALAITQKITVAPANGPVGGMVTITGTGFSPGKVITVKYNGSVVTTNPAALTSDTVGSFNATFSIPPSSALSNNINASDGTNAADVSFIAEASISVNKVTSQSAMGYVGMDITVTGSGFKPSSTILITFESTPVTVATVVSDAGGSFASTFKVPAATSGNHAIRVSDGIISKDIPFFMDSTAPAPVALSPPTPRQPVEFNWSSVVDPSGVTYTLQISQDMVFNTLILERTGLTNNTYNMAEAGKLKSSNSPYYWRVRAIDLAGNMGDWATAGSVKIGYNWLGWIIFIMVAIGVLIILIVGVWVRRKTPRKHYKYNYY